MSGSRKKQVHVKKDFSKASQPGGTPFLTIKLGDIVTVLKESSTGWVMCMKDDQNGYVPALCLDLANPIEASPPAPALESAASSYSSFSNSAINATPTTNGAGPEKKKKKLPADAKYGRVNRAFSKDSPPDGTPFLTITQGDMVYTIKNADNGWVLACPVDDISTKGYVPAMCVDILGPATEYKAERYQEPEAKNDPSPVRQAQPVPEPVQAQQVVQQPTYTPRTIVQDSPRGAPGSQREPAGNDDNDTDRIVRLIRLELDDNGLRYECEFQGAKGTYVRWKPAAFFTQQASSALAAYAEFSAKHMQAAVQAGVLR